MELAFASGSVGLLVTALLLACAFEFVNGFHDTANAVATVIYTNSLRPWVAVVWSGVCNFAGVFLGGIAVAMSIIHLLPFELVLSGGTVDGMAMVFALLGAAILWNVGTWWLGLPASSSHTLIGAILGVGLANGLTTGVGLAESVQWGKAVEVGIALLASPLLGFAGSALLVVFARRFIRNPALYQSPPKGQPPPLWVRSILVLTCTGVSFAHGSNDGQKGVGLFMLILIGLVPASFATNLGASPAEVRAAHEAAQRIETVLARAREPKAEAVAAVHRKVRRVVVSTTSTEVFARMTATARQAFRRDVLRVDDSLKQLQRAARDQLEEADWRVLRAESKRVLPLVEYAPTWVIVAVALSLGIGTMVGWRRIVVTVGEKIGKSHLTYAQGAAAELVAMSTIGFSALVGAPVSTTHVLSSGIAGAMFAQRSGVQMTTVRRIATAWLLTLPASMALAAGLFVLLRRLFS